MLRDEGERHDDESDMVPFCRTFNLVIGRGIQPFLRGGSGTGSRRSTEVEV